MLELTYLGCEGVLLRSGAGSVLIDALYDPAEAEPFFVPDAGALAALRSAAPPFEKVDAILATHYHADHFDAHAVASYLAASAATAFVSSAQAASAVENVAGALPGQVCVLDAVDGVRQRVQVGTVDVQGFGLSHGRVHYADVQHLGLLVTLDGKSILHLGDGIIDEKSMRAAGLFDAPIDLAVLPFWFLTYPFGRRLMERTLRPRNIFAVHIRRSEREQVLGEIASFAQSAGLNAVALTEPLSRHVVD